MRSGWLVIFFVSITECHRQELEKKFLYFAYGSNLLKTRLRINAPSAVFITPARLPGYRLDFDNYSPNWRGAPATIAAIPKSEVWGALWLLNYSEMGALDEQEGLKDGLYEAIDVKVLNLNNHVITARSYKMTSDPPKVHPEVLPLQRRPSNTYIQVGFLYTLLGLLVSGSGTPLEPCRVAPYVAVPRLGSVPGGQRPPPPPIQLAPHPSPTAFAPFDSALLSAAAHQYATAAAAAAAAALCPPYAGFAALAARCRSSSIADLRLKARRHAAALAAARGSTPPPSTPTPAAAQSPADT
ncbi:unnamed protein product [Pieris macdunnoughi]|uniref:gamma-glutamylcyclotransferase n=1 Tax=Pieris macdunnoughi TaxID=345717 RepID=A0A821NZM0_9NEOP|nr:unnamed protein product [Pieris macdunnoughi]